MNVSAEHVAAKLTERFASEAARLNQEIAVVTATAEQFAIRAQAFDSLLDRVAKHGVKSVRVTFDTPEDRDSWLTSYRQLAGVTQR